MRVDTAAYKTDKKAIPVYAILYVGNGGNPFPISFLVLYIQKGAIMKACRLLIILCKDTIKSNPFFGKRRSMSDNIEAAITGRLYLFPFVPKKESIHSIGSQIRFFVSI